MSKRSALFGILSAAFLCASSASADAIGYNITINTSLLSGTAGSLDFNFNPGSLVSQAASLQILNFASDGTLAGSPQTIGDVTGGPLPATVSFDNGTGFNDYFQDFTFGSRLAFYVSLYGPALTSPDGISPAGSTFAFSMFSNTAGTIPALTGDTTNGFAFLADVNLDGTTTVTNLSPETSVTVPEPDTASFLAAAAVLGALMRLRRTEPSLKSVNLTRR